MESTLLELAKEYVATGRGFELRIIDGGWRFFSAQHCADVVARLATDGRSAKLTQAALETLAVVAYKQPVSRARIGAIRGVNVDGVMHARDSRSCQRDRDGSRHRSGSVRHDGVLPGTNGSVIPDDLPAIEDHLPDLAVLDELIEPTV